MPGRPRRTAMIAFLAKRTAEELDDQADASILDYVCHWISSGQTVKALAELATIDTKPDDVSDEDWQISGEMIRRYLDQQYGVEAVDARLLHARTRASYSLVDDAQQIADTVDGDAGEVAKARLRVSARHWMAERFNPSAFGQKQSATVSISIGSLHLDALRSNPKEVTGSLQRVSNALVGDGADMPQLQAVQAVSAQ